MSRVLRCTVDLLPDAGGKILLGEDVMRKLTILVTALAFAWAGGVRAQEAVIAPSETLVTDGITKIPASLAETAGRYTSYRSASFVDWSPTGREMLIATRFADVPQLHLVKTPGGARHVEFDASDDLPAEPLIPGAHNRENAAAATAAARAAGIDDDAIAEALRTFPGVPHRLELVRELRDVRYVNDSKATNTAAARRAVAAYDGPLRLILGGSLKGEDFTTFARELPENVRSIYLIGVASDELARTLDAAGRTYERAGDLVTAVHAAARDAEPGDIVLLSPATASFDQFDNFEHRGDTFRRIVEELP